MKVVNGVMTVCRQVWSESVGGAFYSYDSWFKHISRALLNIPSICGRICHIFEFDIWSLQISENLKQPHVLNNHNKRPRLWSGTSTHDADTLMSVDQQGNLVDLPIDEAIENLPNLYEFKRQLQERTEGLREEVGRKLRVHLDPNPDKVNEVYGEIERDRILDDERMECEEILLKVQMALQQTEFVIQRDEQKEKKEMESRRRKESEERRKAEKEAEEKEDKRGKERDLASNKVWDDEARLARIEQLMAESLALQD